MNKGRVINKKWNLPNFIFITFSLFIFVLYIQLVYLSLSKKIYGKNMTEFAASRNTVKQTLKANRGTIYDRDGGILALNVSSYTLIAYLDENRSKNSSIPLHVEDIEYTAEKLATVLNYDKEYFLKLLKNGKKNNRKQIEFGTAGRGITELVKEEIEALNLPGISFTESTKRYYPNGNFASYVIGYAKEKEVTKKDEHGDTIKLNEIVGELGIESEYDKILKGKDGYLEYQQDRYGYKISGTKEISEKAKDGYDIYLTLDSNIQRFVESAITEVDKEYEPELMMISVMDAKTGDILATSSTPSFDPNVRDIKNYENPLVTYTYEPGSTMKIYTYMCAIDSGVYKGDATFNSGKYKIGDDTINDWNRRGWGKITFDKGFEYSSNVGIANILSNNLKKKEFKDCLKKYGFGKTTDVELTREQTGTINFNYKIEVATAGFGQGITSTAIQQLQALTLIANDGKILKPHIVDKIIDSDNNIYYESKKEESEQIVKTSTVNKMKDLMYNVVNGTDNGTTGKKYKIEGLDIIGKTGTAQISKNGKYLTGDNNYIFSFAGMYPKDDPQIIIYAMMKQPKYGEAAGLYKATKDVIVSISKYIDVDTKKEEKKTDIYTLKSYTNKNVEDVEKTLKNNDLKVVILGDGDKIIKQYPSKDTKVLNGDKVILVTNDKDLKMPSLKGYSRNDVVALFELLDIEYVIDGYGYVEEQSISEGTLIEENTKIKIKLKSRFEEEEE